ncbi:unnamed protein product [Orchesella dallaii]|uniref:E3 ubiquitin-protein ligase CHIP n=1 Tax=Orchesella dallaii TaxID=48710 RepID=A0ABP1PV14_9HEXA
MDSSSSHSVTFTVEGTQFSFSSTSTRRVPKRTFSEMSGSDVKYKDLGNRYFSEENYEKAIECYSKAISKNPSNPVYFTNRALAALKLNRFKDTADDCLKALKLNPGHLKGHYLLGKALCELGSVDEGLKHIQKADELSKLGFGIFSSEIAEALSYWLERRREILDEKEKETCKGKKLEEYLTRLVIGERDRKVKAIRMEMLDKSKRAKKIKAEEEHAKNSIQELKDMVCKAEERNKNREVPDYFCGKITLDILKDPVITPSGITYERKAVEETLERIGPSDPITGAPLVAQQLIPNLALKEAVQAFVEENKWARDQE